MSVFFFCTLIVLFPSLTVVFSGTFGPKNRVEARSRCQHRLLSVFQKAMDLFSITPSPTLRKKSQYISFRMPEYYEIICYLKTLMSAACSTFLPPNKDENNSFLEESSICPFSIGAIKLTSFP